MARCERVPVNPLRPDNSVVARVASVIRAGGVVATPTDTIYGLAADPFNAAAVKQLFRIKRRPETMPILLLIDDPRRVDSLTIDRPEAFARLAERFWPGPLTMILRAAASVPESVTAGTGTIAVRLPRSPLIRQLARVAGRPLTGTSANISGRLGARSADEVVGQIGDRVDLLLDAGRAKRSTPSTIVDLSGDVPRIARAGAIDGAAVLRFLT